MPGQLKMLMPAQLKMLMPAHCSQLSPDWLSQLSRHLSVHWRRIHLCIPMCAVYTHVCCVRHKHIKDKSELFILVSIVSSDLQSYPIHSLSPLALSDGWDFPGCGGKCFPKVPSSTHPCSEGRQINMFSSCCITLKHKSQLIMDGLWRNPPFLAMSEDWDIDRSLAFLLLGSGQ